MLPPESFHTTPIPGDKISVLNSNDIKKLGPKLPQLHLRMDDSMAFTESYKVILEQILGNHNPQSEKEKEKEREILNQIMVEFFKFDIQKAIPINLELNNETDIKILMSENYLALRLEYANLSFEEAWSKIRNIIIRESQNNEDRHETKKVKPARIVKGNRGGHNKKADKKEVLLKPLDIIDRNLARSGRIGLPMIFMMTPDLKNEERLFLPSASSLNAVMYGTLNFYSFFRHFHCLYERLIKARTLGVKEFEDELAKKPGLKEKFEKLSEAKKEELKTERYRKVYLIGLNSILNGDIDAAHYEDFCKQCLGPQGYLMFSLDKLVNSVLYKSNNRS